MINSRNKMKLVFLIFVVFGYFATGEALTCYECSSPPTSGCADPFDKSAKGVLEYNIPAAFACVKIVAEYTSRTEVLRSAIVPTANIWEQFNRGRSEKYPVSIIGIYYCDTDLCNGATSITAALSTLMAVVIALIAIN